MSLVFLKNDTNNVNVGANDHLKPYDWANYFDTPLVLPPDSQVAYISSTMQREEVIDLPAPENVLWLQTGNSQLNLPMPIIFDTTQGAETWSQVTNQITANAYTGQTDFMWDGQSGGLKSTYNATTKKIDITLNQRLQPPVQGVWANRGQALTGSWGGLNQTGGGGASGTNGGTLTTNIYTGTNSTLWDCGWSSMNLASGGQPTSAPLEYFEGQWTNFHSSTGIKRSCDNIALTGLGGEVHFKGELNPGTLGATARAQSIPFLAGLNSVQCIRSVPANPGSTSPQSYVDGCILNSESDDVDLHPNIIQIRMDAQKVYVEVMNDTGRYPQGQFAIEPGCWGNAFTIPNTTPDTSLYCMKVVEEIDIETWLQTPLTQPQNTGGQASQPYFNALQGGIQANNYNQITFKIKWNTPYTFQVYMGTGYEERTGKYEGTTIGGGEQYPVGTAYQDTYSIIYDSETGGNYTNGLTPDETKTFIVPSYFGDLGFCGWIDRRNDLKFRGNFDVINCYPANPAPPYPSYDQMLVGINGINIADTLYDPPDDNNPVFANCYHLSARIEDGIFPEVALDEFDAGALLAVNAGYNDAVPLLVAGVVKPETPARFQRWFPPPLSDALVFRTFAPPPSPDTRIGIVMGLLKKSNDDGVLDFTLVTPNDLRIQNITGVEEVGETEIYNSVHIQLTNLPINGRNGMTSTKTATIAVVHNSLSTVTVGNQARKLYNHYTNEKNFIDLNNVAEMTLNELRVYISNDANRPATYLVDKSDVVVMFRKRPESDTGVSRQVINKGGVYSSNGMTNR